MVKGTWVCVLGGARRGECGCEKLHKACVEGVCEVEDEGGSDVRCCSGVEQQHGGVLHASCPQLVTPHTKVCINTDSNCW